MCIVYTLQRVWDLAEYIYNLEIWNANSDRYYPCFRLFFDSKFRAGGTGVAGRALPDFGKSTNQTCWIVKACMNAYTSRLSDLPPALHIDFLASLKLLVKRYRWKILDGDSTDQ